MKSKFKFAPSLLSADLLNLGDEIESVLSSGADMIHLDIMDNHYVPNLTFGPALCHAIRKQFPKLVIDVHLMVSPVDPLIEKFISAGASRLAIHPDATTHLDRSLSLIKDAGLEAGLVLNPATPIDCLTWCAHRLDFVLIMTVNPGFGGQNLIHEIIGKISAVHHLYPHLKIAVDGGVSLSNLKMLAEAGATEFVAGTAIFNTSSYADTLKQMKSLLSSP